MTRSITMGGTGNFTVSGDYNDIIATALLLATAPQHIHLVEKELAPNGEGFHVETIGSIYRLDDRADLVPPFDRDPAMDPETNEVWMLVRDGDRDYPSTGRFIMHGDELRALVREAIALRKARRI